MIKILISGVSGRLGQQLSDCMSKVDDMVVTAGVDKYPNESGNHFAVYSNIEDVIETVDIIIDFSRPDALAPILSFAESRKCGVVIGTTGHTAAQKELIREYGKKIPVFYTANMSLGVNLQMELIRKAAEFLGDAFDVEIIEKHHNVKVDSPSGTALALAEELNRVYFSSKEFVYGRNPLSGPRSTRQIGIHAVRGGTLVGEHEVLFLGNDEVLSVHHQALSKQVFAMGAIRAARFLSVRAPGLYSMADMIAEATTVTRIYSDDRQALVNLTGVPYVPSIVADIFNRLAKRGINIDIINQTFPQDDIVSITFSIPQKDSENVQIILTELAQKYPLRFNVTDAVTKLTIEGMGMERESGVAAKLFSVLASQNIPILIISTSETKILLCIENKHTAAAIRVITKAFKL